MMDTLDRHSSQELQHQIQSLILATDIARQHEFLTAFKVSISIAFIPFPFGFIYYYFFFFDLVRSAKIILLFFFF